MWARVARIRSRFRVTLLDFSEYVEGVSSHDFQVGSGLSTPWRDVRILRECLKVFDIGSKAIGWNNEK